ncbi:DNA-binding protein RFX5 [Protopterus annectens]|uniref:DNA-binding protein RFX5 n=1 Tax=Protopterus annectens TaxID=7888 RepID=UPI001CFB3ACA|nr:DNA-binding protein RFX5 [Protopterus annectens]XP_043936564.1 DNA-binding protein RFX5 [Protopterus annectens]
MTKDKPQMKLREHLGSCSPGEDATEPNTLLQKLRNNISKHLQSKVDSILQDVQKFSDVDKLYLYLQLPSGLSSGDKSGSLDLSSLSTADQMHACTWIRNHLEEHTDTCLPKQDVYDAYRRYCDNLGYRPLSAANFGKIFRDVFPNIKARRLGGRGQSKYCYGGIRRKTVVTMPPLPSLDLKLCDNSDLSELVQCHNSEVMDAACALICDWAGKILKRTFDTVVEVAQFLIQQHIINPKSANAKLVTSVTISENTSEKSQLYLRVDASSYVDDSQSETDQESRVTPKQTEKKKIQESQKSATAACVDVLVARMPPLLPRTPLVKNTDTAGSSSPVLTTVGGTIKVATLPMTVGAATSSIPITLPASSTGLGSQQASMPVINMLVPNVQSTTLAIPFSEIPVTVRRLASESCSPCPGKSSETVESGLSEPHNAIGTHSRLQKRTAESAASVSDETIDKKRKRGRPRKMQSEVQQTPLSTVPSQINKEVSDSDNSQKHLVLPTGAPSDNTADSEIEAVTLDDSLNDMTICSSSQNASRADQTVIKVARAGDGSSFRSSHNTEAAHLVITDVTSGTAADALYSLACSSKPVLGKVTEAWNASESVAHTSDLSFLETTELAVTSVHKEDNSDGICIDDSRVESSVREMTQNRSEGAHDVIAFTKTVPLESQASPISEILISSQLVAIQEEHIEQPRLKNVIVTSQRMNSAQEAAQISADIKLNESTSVLDNQTLTTEHQEKYSTVVFGSAASQLPAARPSCISIPKISKALCFDSDIDPNSSAASVEVSHSEPCLSTVDVECGKPGADLGNVDKKTYSAFISQEANSMETAQ